jgi:hypothetical protein
MAPRCVLTLVLSILGVVPVAAQGGSGSGPQAGISRTQNADDLKVISMEDFRPGDTLRYTTDGSVPDRTSRFVLPGANNVPVSRTTLFKARLYRPGFMPSGVQSHTVFVRDSLQPARAALRK